MLVRCLVVKESLIIKHLCFTSTISQDFILIATSFFNGVFTVLEDEGQDFYIINWRNTLENPQIISVALKISRGERAKCF